MTNSNETLDTLFDKLSASADPATADDLIRQMHAIAARDCLNLDEFGLDNANLRRLHMDACIRRATAVRTQLATGTGLPDALEREMRQLLRLGVLLGDIDLTEDTYRQLLTNAWKRALPGTVQRLRSDYDSNEDVLLIEDDLHWLRVVLQKSGSELSADDQALVAEVEAKFQLEPAS